MARSVKRVVLVLLAAAIAAFAAWMLWPRSLAGAFDFDQPFTLTVTELELQEDGRWTSGEPVSAAVEPGTPAAEAVRAALEEESYHLCLSTLTGDPLIDGTGDQIVSLYGSAGQEKNHLTLYAGNSRLNAGGRVVRGYFRDGAALCGELAAILRPE